MQDRGCHARHAKSASCSLLHTAYATQPSLPAYRRSHALPRMISCEQATEVHMPFATVPYAGLSMQQAQPQQQQQQQRVVGHKVSSGGWELPVKRPRGRQSDDVASAGPSSHPYHAAWASGPGHNPDA